jgi:hypothetical protein
MSLRNAICFSWNNVFAPLFVITVSIFLFFRIEEPKTVYHQGTVLYEDQKVEVAIFFLVPATLCLFAIAAAKHVLVMWDNDVYRQIWRFVVRWWTFGITYVLLGINTLQQWMIGKIFLGFSIANLGLVGYWMYLNINFFRIFTDIFTLVLNFALYFTEPARVIASYIDLLRSFCALSVLRYIQDHYIFPLKIEILEGKVQTLFGIVLVSVLLVVAVLILEFIRRNIVSPTTVFQHARRILNEVFGDDRRQMPRRVPLVVPPPKDTYHSE